MKRTIIAASIALAVLANIRRASAHHAACLHFA
jgi:hypothetical protein